MSSQDDRLESLIARALRDPPLRSAPTTLEARVLAKLSGESTRAPHGRFTGWSRTARFAFVVVSSAIAVLTLAAVYELAMHLDARSITSLAPQPSWWGTLADAAFSLREVAPRVLRAIPDTWLYGALGLIAMVHATFLMLAAAAYRGLWGARHA